MQAKKAISLLRAHRDELDKMGIKRIAIFGSTARNEARKDSDIDVLIEFSSNKGNFDQFMTIKFYLEDLLDKKVDLVTTKAIRPQLKPYIEKDAIYVPR